MPSIIFYVLMLPWQGDASGGKRASRGVNYRCAEHEIDKAR